MGNVRQSSTKFDSTQNHSHNSSVLAFAAIWRWAADWIVSWFSLNVCTETSSPRRSCAVLISLNFVHFSDLTISENFFFQRQFSNSTNPYCASCSANICSSVCRCSSPMHMLRDSTWSSCFARSDLSWLSKWSLLPSRRDPLKFGWVSVSEHRTPDQVSLLRWKQCIGCPRSFLTFRWIETSNFPFDRLACIVHLHLSPARPLHRVSPKLPGRTVVNSASFVTHHLRDENLQSFPRNRRKCICDWK